MMVLSPNVMKEVWEIEYPINRVVIFHDAEDHSNYLNFKWALEFQDRFPIGYNPNNDNYNQIGKTGGEETHILSTNEMPSHSHSIRGCYGKSSDVDQSSWSSKILAADGGSPWCANMLYSQSYMPTINTAGNSAAHNNMPPFIVTSYWRRIS